MLVDYSPTCFKIHFSPMKYPISLFSLYQIYQHLVLRWCHSPIKISSSSPTWQVTYDQPDIWRHFSVTKGAHESRAVIAVFINLNASHAKTL